MRCQFAFDDAGYVLGALPPDERREFVNHLPTCADCRASVRDLAGLPGLLARVEPSDVEALDGPVEPAPATILPRLLAEAQADRFRARRRRATMLAMAACFIVLAVIAVPLAVVGLGGRNAPPVATKQISTTLSMRSVVGTVPVRAAVGLSDTKWGTDVTLRCAYDKAEYATEQSYGLFAVVRGGRTEQLGSWSVRPGEEYKTTASTRYHRSQLQALEIRRTDGQTVLRADL